jgi:hypothetical protein
MFIPTFNLLLLGYEDLENWVKESKLDGDVSEGTLLYMQKVNQHRELLLIILITLGGFHTHSLLMLILGACLRPSASQRLLFVPWLTLDMFFIVLVTALFVSWAFLSFFVHILVAIFSPVVCGALLGLWIYSWRNVRELFVRCGQESDKIDLARRSQSETVYRKLPPGSQSPTELRLVPHFQHHVPV